MDETTALTTTTTNDQGLKRKKRGSTPWIVLTVVLLGLAAFYSAGLSRRGKTMALQQLSSFGDTADSVEFRLNLGQRLATTNDNTPSSKPSGIHQNLQCNPSEHNANGCKNDDCAAPNWVDGCKACMCGFNNESHSWCDGTRNEFYDTYFDQHGSNLWGDRDRENQKCSNIFRNEGSTCNHNWQCQKGLCQIGPNSRYYCLCEWLGYPTKNCPA